MGGDFAPRATVAGALLALCELDSEHTIQLVGRSQVIGEQLDALLAEAEFATFGSQRARLSVVDALKVRVSTEPAVRCDIAADPLVRPEMVAAEAPR